MCHHVVAVGTKGHWGRFSTAATATAAPAAISAAAATATAATAVADAVLGHGREEVGVLFHDEIELLALDVEFCT